MSLAINDNGTWKNPINVSVNDNGIWKDVKRQYINDNGTWKEVFASAPTFDTTLTSWTIVGNALVSYPNGGIYIDDQSPYHSGIEKTFTVEAGKSYNIQVTCTARTWDYFVQVDGAWLTNRVVVGISSNTVTATSTSMVVRIETGSGINRGTTTISDILIEEV